MADDSVSADAKYSGACAETATRITARDNVMRGFVTLASAFIGVALSNPKLVLLGAAVGYVALAAALLTRHHDVIIGLLGQFQNDLCEDCEEKNWFARKYHHRTLKERNLRDISLALTLAGAGAIGLWVAAGVGLCSPDLPGAVTWWTGLLSLFAAQGVVYSIRHTRMQIHEESHQRRSSTVSKA